MTLMHRLEWGLVYASLRGDSYLAYWEYGLGGKHDGKMDHDFEKYRSMKQIIPKVVAAQIGIYYEL